MSDESPSGASKEPHWSELHHDSLEPLGAALEESFGSRWAGMWIETRERAPTIGIAVVAPTVADIMWAEARAKESEWAISIHGVRYSEAELYVFQDRIEALMGGSGILSVGRDEKANRVRVTLNELVEPTLDAIVKSVPSEVLLVEIRLGKEWVMYTAAEVNESSEGSPQQ